MKTYKLQSVTILERGNKRDHNTATYRAVILSEDNEMWITTSIFVYWIKFHWKIVRGQRCCILSVKIQLHIKIMKSHSTELCHHGIVLSYKER